MKGYMKAVIGALIGAATTGVWLTVDLVTPEPYGDFALFGLMAIANAGIGWQVARLMEKKRIAENGGLEGAEEGLKTN